jgi:hypothetical protein
LNKKRPQGNGRSTVEKGRARRFELQIALRYRANGESHWHKGVTKNISYSGVLFEAENDADPKTLLELSLALPKHVTGGWPAEVVCKGTVMRSERGGDGRSGSLIASSISHYRFVRP